MSSTGPKLIAGLGNPGAEYADTRHNVGFWFLDALAREYRLTLRLEKRFTGDISQLDWQGQSCRLLKPVTYMNHSGRSVAGLIQYYDIAPESLLVVHDEIDLPPGAMRLKFGGGHGGHNGLRDIIQNIGADFYRLRIGVGHPGHRDDVVHYVLGRPSQEDRQAMEDCIAAALAELPGLLAGEYKQVMNRLHRKPSPTDPDTQMED